MRRAPRTARLGKLCLAGIGPLRARRFPRPTPARARRGGWEGPCQISRPTARFLPETASRRETRTTHRPTSYEPLLPNFVSDRRRPHGERCPTLRWPDRLETAPKKTIVGHFAWFLAVFSASRAAFCCRVFCNASSDCRGPAGAAPRRSAMLGHAFCQVLESSGIKAASVINKWLSLRALSLSLINKLLN